MAQNNSNNTNYYEYYDDEGLTFSRIFKFLGKSFPRICLYAVIGIIISSIIMIAVYFSSIQKSTSTIVNYTFAGIEDGEDPLGGEFNKNDIISSSILKKAISEQGLESLEVSDLQDRIVVEDVIPQKILTIVENINKTNASAETLAALEEYEYNPTRYVVSIGNYRELGLNSTEAKALLNEIVEQYKASFKETYSSITLDVAFNVSDFSKIGTEEYVYGYVESLDILTSALKQATVYLDSLSPASASYRAKDTGLSFNDISIRLNTLNNISLNNLYNYVIEKKVGIGSLSYLKSTYDSLLIDEENYTLLRNNQQSAVDSYKNTVAIVTAEGSVTEVNVATEVYNNMIETLKEYNLKLADITKNKKIIEKQISSLQETGYTATEADFTLVNTQIKTIAQSVDELVSAAETMINDYNENYLLKNVIISTSAIDVATSDWSLGNCIVVIVIVAVLAACLAMFVQYIKNSNNKAKATAVTKNIEVETENKTEETK